MGRQEEVVAERLKKLAILKNKGLNPYVSKFETTHITPEIHQEHTKLKNGEVTKKVVRVAGRLKTFRDFGKIAFGVLDDGHGTIQVTLQKPTSPQKVFDFVKEIVDIGDFIGVEGVIARSERGELSVIAKEVTMLTKSILPLPDKWHGITDDEERLRKRYLDILMNKDTKEMFLRKSKFWNTIRSFLIEKGFLEVETPVLENSAGGASATPFKTHHNALNIDVYLRISMGELWQKKLMVAGFPRTFEIGRQFRNEGMDAEHLQDYTQMEFYWGYANYKDGMKLVEEMYKHVAKTVYGKTKFKIGDFEVDLGKKWEIIDYADTIRKELGLDIFKATPQDMEKKLQALKQDFQPGLERGRLMDLLWKVCRRKIAGPGFLTGQPVEVSPLAKRDSKDPRKVEQFQVILAGSEMGNGYSELNDPIDQEERFQEQRRLKEAGDNEAQEHDEGFVEALKYGMPPTCGFGVSERLFSIFEGKPIRETVIFPLMKPAEIPKAENGADAKKHHEIPESIPSGKKVSLKEARKLLQEYVASESLRNHCEGVAAAMKKYAFVLKEDAELWEITGLLHDFDYEKYPDKHTIAGTSILIDKKYPAEIIRAILSHYSSFTGINRKSPMEKVLFAVDELVGLITALSKVRADKFASITPESVEKALKKKDFAAKISRQDIELGVKEVASLGISRDKHFRLVIEALQRD